MIIIEKLFFLKSVPLFKYTPDDLLLDLAYLLKERYVPAGDAIIEMGAFGDVMYIIAEGTVKVHNKNVVWVELKQCDVFGELAALSPEIRTASVSALENTVLLEIDNKLLYNMMERNIGLVKGIIEVLCHRTRALSSQLENFSSLNAGKSTEQK